MAKNTKDEPVQESASTELSPLMSEDILADLMKAQQESLGNFDLPKITVMGAGSGMFKFEDDEKKVESFTGVILGAHSRNVLWTKKMLVGSRAPVDDDGESKRPACSSPDGKHGTPQKGFLHKALKGAAAEGTELIECGTCPYNKFGSGAEFIADKNPKGKAVTNQKAIYIWLPDRVVPMQLIISSTSLGGYEEYIKLLSRRGQLAITMLTTFSQIVKDKDGVDYGVVTFAPGAPIGREAFADVYKMYKEYQHKIEPKPQVQVAAAAVAKPATPVKPEVEEEPDYTVEDAEKTPAEDKEKVPF